MELKEFIENKYDISRFIQFISERFYGFEEEQTEPTDEDLNESEKAHIQSYRYLGRVELDDGKELGFFEFLSKSKNIENKRVGYNAVLKKLADYYGLDGAMASFYHPDSEAWRLSFIGFDFDEGKAKATNLKRYTFVLGKGIPTKTAYQQLKELKYPKFKEIEEAFSVEAITDEFYKSYKTLFELINNELVPQKALFSGAQEKPEVIIRSFSRRLLGRITFLYFLQKKGWLGVKQKWGDGERKFLKRTYDEFIKKKKNGSFYTEIMIPLFFTALNTPRDNNYFPSLSCKIPFLNGGLFTREAYDLDEIFLSNELFGKIFDTFDQYNFTIIEDLPHDSEVAIDPEMLGRVFENLIEENYRKGKGAFYTPREIVHYMCKQSIIMYLANYFEQEKIEHLVNDEVTDDPYIKKHAIDIKDKLLQMKVLDPAIGSGAFPMGILHEMVQVIGNLNKAENPSKEKKQIIENSIYGVDIDGSAVDIAKLRFWLSIIVDEDEPFPLPNLAFKIMQGNSLIETIDGFSPVPEDLYVQKEPTMTSLFDEGHTTFDINKFEQLRQDIHEFYNASNTKKKDALHEKIKHQIKEIIIGYIDAKEKELKARQKDFDGGLSVKNREKTWNKIVELQDAISKARKIINEMLKNNFQTTELFLYKLWFGEVMRDGGFDIVIGNPPYLRVQGIDREISENYKKIFDSATGSYDLYVLFVEKGMGLLNDNGILNYIMPHKWVNSSFGKGLRKLVAPHMRRLISFDAYQVFHASTYTSLLWLSKKESPTLEYVQLEHDLATNKELENFLNRLDHTAYTPIPTDSLRSDTWVLTDKATYEILQKLYCHPLKVKDVFEKIYQGIATGKDSVYFLKECKEQGEFVEGFSEELAKRVTIEKGLTKPLLKGDDVHRYEPLQTDKVVIFPYYITIDERGKEKAELYTEAELQKQFPKGYAYIKECEGELRGRERGRFNVEGQWFQFSRKQGIIGSEHNKILMPYLSYGSQLTYDEQGGYYTNTKVFGLIRKDDFESSYNFLLSILNSKLCWYFISKTSSVMRGGYFTYTKETLSPFPIPEIKSKETIKPFETLVDYTMWLRANKEHKVDKYVDNLHIAKEFEAVIDAMVYELYFESELHEKDIYFISHAQKMFSSIDSNDDKVIVGKKIHQAYQILQKRDNPIRNNLQLMKIRLEKLIVPIERSI